MGASGSRSGGGRGGATFEVEELTYRWPACRYLSLIRTIVGVVTCIAIWNAGINGITTYFILGIYLCVIAVPITILELSFLINKVACCGRGGLCCRVWHLMLWMDSWKRGVVYILLAIPTFIMQTLWGILCGVALVTCGVLYLAKPWQFTRSTIRYRRDGTAIPPVDAANLEDAAAQP